MCLKIFQIRRQPAAQGGFHFSPPQTKGVKSTFDFIPPS
ncbi:MAG: CRISPR-associated protein Cas5 [Desulfosarcina sp.]|nr:CRISPR-associated protein Cas5 [Desulfobacterales bacterium]